MNVIRLKVLTALKEKHLGNKKLRIAIDQLISDLREHDFSSHEELKTLRKDADRVHSDGFYFFNMNVHRTMIMIGFGDDGEATIVWAGSHDEYERTFKNNKSTIETWLRSKGWID